MKQNFSDEHLAADLAAQAKLISLAYASGNDFEIDQALIRVTDLRRMVSTGILDLVSKEPE